MLLAKFEEMYPIVRLIFLFCLPILAVHSCSKFTLFQKEPMEIYVPVKDTSLRINIRSLPELKINRKKEKKRQKQEAKYRLRLKELFQPETSPMGAYKKLKSEFSDARNSGMLAALFSRFAEAPCFIRHRRKGPEFTEFLGLWVKDALVQSDDDIRLLYSDFYYKIRPVSLAWRPFMLKNNRLRPGDSLELSSHALKKGESGKGTFQVKVERLSLDDKGKAGGYKSWHNETLTAGTRICRYMRSMETSGLYRVSIHNRFFFQQFYFQVSWLDVTVKTDGGLLLIWGSSYKNFLPPPYELYLYREDGRKYKLDTDSAGLCVLIRRSTDYSLSEMFRLLVTKDGNFAFARGSMQALSERRDDWFLDIHTDKREYRKGQKVHYRGILMKKSADGYMPPEVDMIKIGIYDFKDREIYAKFLLVDDIGQFGDSLELPVSAETGEYRIMPRYVRRKKSDDEREELRLEGSVPFYVKAQNKSSFTLSVSPSRKKQKAEEPVRVVIKGHGPGGVEVGMPVVVRWYESPASILSDLSSPGKTSLAFRPGDKRTLLRVDTVRFSPLGFLKLAFDATVLSSGSFLVVEAEAMVSNRVRAVASAFVQVARHDLYIWTQLENHEVKTGEKVNITYHLIPVFKRLDVSDVCVRVFQDADTVLEETLMPDSIGSGLFAFQPRRKGAYTIEFAAEAGGQETVSAKENVYVYDRLGENWGENTLRISSDKRVYQRGDTARLVVNTGLEGAWVLCTVEDIKLLYFRARYLSTGRTEFLLPVDRLGDAGGIWFSCSGREAMIRKNFSLEITDTNTSVQIGLSGGRILKPSEEFVGKVKITDYQGRPVSAQFSVALERADKQRQKPGAEPGQRRVQPGGGVLGSPVKNILNFRDRRGVRSFSGSYYGSDLPLIKGRFPKDWPGLLDPPVTAPAPIVEADYVQEKKWSLQQAGGSEGDGSGVIQRGLESLLRDKTPDQFDGVWLPLIATNDSGEAILEFSVPDTRCVWDMIITGNTSDGAFRYEDKIRVEQSLRVDLQTPQSFTAGDEAMVLSELWNYSSYPLSVQAVLTKDFPENSIVISGDSIQSVSMDPETHTVLQWPVRFTGAGTGKLALHAFAAHHVHQDSEVVIVRNLGRPGANSQSNLIRKDKTKSKLFYRLDLNMPEGSDFFSREMEIEFFPTAVLSALDALKGLELKGNPSLEMLINNFLPHLELAESLPFKPGRDSLFKQAGHRAMQAMKSLVQWQNPDGGFGWWVPDDTDPRMTSLAIQGMTGARTALGDEWSAAMGNMYRRGIESALSQLKQKKLDDGIKSYLAFAVCNTPEFKKTTRSILEVYKKRKRLSSYSLALLYECLYKLKLKAEAGEVRALLVDRVLKISSEASWSGDYRYAWFNQSIETTAQVLYVLARNDPDHDFISRIIPYLSRKKSNGGWVSPKTTAMVIRAIAAWAPEHEEWDLEYTGKIFLNKKKYHEFPVAEALLRDFAGVLNVPLPDISRENRIVLGFEGQGRLHYSGTLRYFLPMQSIPASGREFTLAREYHRLVYSEDGKGGWDLQLVPVEREVQEGDELEARITIKTYKGYEFVKIEDFIPPGFIHVEKTREWYGKWMENWNWSPSSIEKNGDRLVMHVNRMPEGEHTYRYLMRAETPGSYRIWPAEVSLAYNPEVRGNSADEMIIVTEITSRQ
ncbi:alpha-2-macroglobulin family protein [Fibrobacterota bacterium]